MKCQLILTVDKNALLYLLDAMCVLNCAKHIRGTMTSMVSRFWLSHDYILTANVTPSQYVCVFSLFSSLRENMKRSGSRCGSEATSAVSVRTKGKEKGGGKPKIAKHGHTGSEVGSDGGARGSSAPPPPELVLDPNVCAICLAKQKTHAFPNGVATFKRMP